MVVVNPTHDVPTRYLDMWISQAVDYINSLDDVQAIRLKGDEATADKLLDSISEHNPELVMFNGHGNADAIIGHDSTPLISSTHTIKAQFIGRILHAVVCSAAYRLGQELVDIGAKAFVGYSDKFYFWQHGDDTNDAGAKLFLEPALEVSKQLCEGNSARSSYVASQKMYARNLKAELSVNGASDVSSALEHNIRNHVLLGDGDATIWS